MPLAPSRFDLALAVGLIAVATSTSVQAQDPPDIVAEFQAVCIAGRGAAAVTESAALARGYAPVEATRAEEAVAGQDDPPRVWSLKRGEVETRVVSAPGSLRGTGPSMPVQRCFVAMPAPAAATRRQIADLTGVDSFRRRDTAVFAWLETPNGSEGVDQGSFERGLIPLLRERGLQAIMVTEQPDQLVLSYVTARR